eukprot:gnl/MRDRNA2_/MRDRNA2_106664_c0_seq1.p1 gnl/MRDRNA2_/MRDRNA2_106664_c0~~gnl/MRDRNA2_/MRDRNA2_106664_c0_seq1.p1  ORF type:complete len:2501 (-),score=441.00 gnl/MRDRNA2_/MRDRNA2_106664_c0_seq1:75-7259(-)
MLVSGLQNYLVEYRLAAKAGESRINDVYVANWFSAQSDPVATVVDPPTAPVAQLFSQGDYANVGVKLTFGATNKEFLQKVAGEEGPWAGYPGLGINKLQVRWRVLRRAASEGIRSPGPDLISKLATGDYRTSNMIEATAVTCPFDPKSETWSYLCSDCPHGVVARFAVRVGTAYRWSPWSEESDDVDVAIAPPQPKLTPNNSLEEIQIREVFDNGAMLKWPGFTIPDGLSFIEYRVSVCLLKTKTQDPNWSEAPVVEIFGTEAKESHEYRVKGLIPDSLYVFRVDARYPNIGDRGWSVPIMNSVPIRTEIPSRQPPGAPIPVPIEEVNVILQQEAESTGKTFPLEEDQPWVMMLVESSRLEEYEIEFAPSTFITLNSEAGVANWSPPAETINLGITLDENHDYTVVAVLLERAPADWSSEAFVCRLRHKNPSTVSPLLWTGSASTSVVPVVSKPETYSFEPKMDIQRGDFGIGVRFYLGSAPADDKIDAISAVKSVERTAASAVTQKHKRTTRVHRIGHRCVSHMQLRMRLHKEDESWITLRPRLIGTPKLALHDSELGAVPSWNHDKPPAPELLAAAALLWDIGDRYETFLHQSDGLVPGNVYDISLRVGTMAQWSEWVTSPSPVVYNFPLPRPPSIVGREGSLKLNMSASATVLMLKFPPFQMEPGLGNAEYVITAEPQFEEDLKAVPKNQRKQGRETGYTGLEGGKTVEKTLLVSQIAMKTDEQVMQHLVDKRLVQGLNDIADLSPILTQESGAEIDQLYGTDMQHVEVELSGLLPSTRYFVTVAARVAHLPGAPLGVSLTAAMETLPGSAPPAPPLQLMAPPVASISTADRAVFLEFDDRTDYVLEYRIADQGKAWFPQVQGGNQASKRWWSTQEEGDWQIVPQMHSVSTSAWPKGSDGSPKKGIVCQVAELPAFEANAESLKANVQLPDVVELRLRVVDRSGAHPCRWLGSITKPMAVCFAPLVQRPFPKRVFSDAAWQVHISFFLFTRTCPPVKLVAQAREQLEESEFSELVDAEPSLAPGIPAPPAVEEDEGETPVGSIPVGFGHKQVNRIQVRYRLVSATSDDMRDEFLAGSLSNSWVLLEGFDLSRCTFAGKSAGQGDRHVLKLSAEHGLQEGGVYEVQLRAGDEYRWSAWSTVSQRFQFEVPAPIPQEEENAIQLSTFSASVVLCKWRPFVLAKGLTKVQYHLRAEPLNESQNGHGAAVVAKIHEVTMDSVEGDGFWVETEMTNLVPATPYRFSIAARYPTIGSREWSRTIEASINRLEDLTADWPQLQAPVVLMHNGPCTFLQLEGEATMFHPSERAFLLAFPETRSSRDGISYRLEYKHVGLHLGNDQQHENLWPVDYRSKWRTPVEASRVDLPADKAKALEAFVPWKMPLRLWRVRLAPVPSLEDAGEVQLAQMQRVQFRLTADAFSECPITRWFSAPTSPLCSAIAPPMETAASLLCLDERIGMKINFVLSEMFTVPALIRAKGAEVINAFHAAMSQIEGSDHAPTGPSKMAPRLPQGFGHGFATHFQFRYRHSPKPNNVPWSSWFNGPDTGLQFAVADHGIQQTTYTVEMAMSGDNSLQYGQHYQVSVRLSDGSCWSHWSEPSAPTKVYVAPPSATSASESVQVHSMQDSNIRLKWPLLKSHGGLSLVEYGVFIRQVLQDGTELCPRQQAALVQGRAKEAGAVKSARKSGQKVQIAHGVEYFKEGDKEMMTCEIRDLRKDVTYVFSVGARYPYIGTRNFEDAMHSNNISIGSAGTKMPVPIQVYMPEARLRRFQGSRAVLLRWSFTGINQEFSEDEKTDQGNLDALVHEHERRYELQALGEDEDQSQWHTCTNISRMKVDGMMCWAVKDLPFKGLRGCFRLWDKDAGRFGRCSPMILTQMEPVTKVSVVRVISTRCVSLVLRAPLNAPRGTQEYACRYQLRYKLATASEETWTELPVNMVWHQQNDHLQNDSDMPIEPLGAVHHGLENMDQGDITISKGASQVMFPTIPLASVGACGAVSRQRCLIASVREEDGIDMDRLYVFSIRIGDLYRLSEWSEPSAPVRLAVAPPLLDTKLGTRMAQLHISNLTGNKATVHWPQFLPAIKNSVPMETEVDYLLTVTPQTSNPNQRGKETEKQVTTPPHCQILQTAALASGSTSKDLTELSAEVFGLRANTMYEFTLSVRYTALGTRQWTKVLQTNITTDKDEDRFAVEITAAMQNTWTADSGPPHERMAMTHKKMVVPLDTDKRVELDARPLTVCSARSPTPTRPHSLPAMDSRPAAPRVTDPQPEEQPRASSAQEFEEWAVAVQREAEKVTGGTVLECLHLEGTARRIRDRTPNKPPGTNSFWTRDPADRRPSMPPMPAMPPRPMSTVSPETSISPEPAAIPTKPPSGRSLSSRGRYIRGPDDQNLYPRRIAR